MEGDRKAQYELYQQYAKAMFNICVRMTNNIEEAEDLLQEAFIKAFANIQSYKGDATFGAWLKRIVVNQCINHLHKKKVQFDSLDDMYQEPATDTSEVDQEQYDIHRIREAIQLLPDGYRVVFSLYLLEGYDHVEIAEVLGISVSASKSQYSRAKTKLRQLLNL
ncbi:RNA polymerase sigma factor [Algivirga pacifica]|uniref:RNA polymerase sigma factor n=2 Tax=Algivirga pacifica TaxID=1162670 RepID=A0ABP9DBQ2_9BACT